jgi:hypothetical protein
VALIFLSAPPGLLFSFWAIQGQRASRLPLATLFRAFGARRSALGARRARLALFGTVLSSFFI